MATIENLHAEVRREDVVSWIEEFSYIFSTETFDLDDGHLGNKLLSSWQQSTGVDIVVLKPTSQFPKTPLALTKEPHILPIPHLPAPTETQASTEFSAPEKQTLESDNEAREPPTLDSECSICGSRYPKSSTKRLKRKWKRIKLFCDRVKKKKSISGCPHCTHLAQDTHQGQENGRDDVYEAVQPPEAISQQVLQPPGQLERLSQPKDSRPSKGPRLLETPHLLTKTVSPNQKRKRKKWLPHQRDDSNSNYNEKSSKDPRTRPPYSWFSDTKRYLELFSSRSSNTLAKVRRPWGVPLSKEDGQDIFSETSERVTVDDASSYSTTPSSPRHVSAGTSTGSRTLTAGSKTPSCKTSHTNFDQYLRLNIGSVPLSAPRPYQCTFCLVKCTDKQDWLQHERFYHFQKCWTSSQDSLAVDEERNNNSQFSQGSASTCAGPRIEGRQSRSQKKWSHTQDTLVADNERNNNPQSSQGSASTCSGRRIEGRQSRSQKRWSDTQDTLVADKNGNSQLLQGTASTCADPRPESFQSSSQINREEHVKDWFWNCGFCDGVLRSWDERQEHIISEHFANGTAMSLWDPLKPPYPWDRNTGIPISGFPSWNLQELRAIRQPNLVDSIDR
ncbi:hypothetical protein FQN54_004417 [Arachnomyces sp. PD_36]|nr:hypothetical protein FQN54_004417 [Arachnomyces sp. PD_36]